MLSNKKRCASNLKSLLCDLCELCAMLFPDTGLSRPEAMLSTKSVGPSNLKSPSVTSVTSVRCFPRRGPFPPRSHAVHQKALRRRTSNPPSVTSVTSVRCFPRRASFPPRSHAVHQKRWTVEPQIPLCDLRDLCAMLSPMRVFP
jgi:hypothetical protein